MKILYISKGDHVDYQDDCLCIGLKELFGGDVIDINKRSHIYDTFDIIAASKLYGMGMSVTRVLPDLDVDRTDIESKIKNKYFDYIIYGSIHRCGADINKVLQYYPSNRVIVIDGEDETGIKKDIWELGVLYFKRELIYDLGRLFPISFAIPTSKVITVQSKTRGKAICDPRDRSTYIYKNEKDYYNGYAESCMGVTMSKAGWDCMRHYEILANDCIPWFINVDMCPNNIMTTFPKELCKQVNEYMIGKHTYPAHFFNVWEEYKDRFREHTIKHCTTKVLAQTVLDKIISCNDTK